MSEKTADEQYEAGMKIIDEVYGPGYSETMRPLKGVPFVDEIVNTVFGKIWARPGLSIRDRRLLVIGATAMMGRDDLIETQVRGGIINGEFTDEQLAEIPVLMLVYAGAGKTTMTFKGIEAAKVSAKSAKQKG